MAQPLQKLPVEVWIKIFTSIDVVDVSNTTRVCKDWFFPSTQKEVWDILYQKVYLVKSKGNPKSDFVKKFQLENCWKTGQYNEKRKELGKQSINVIEFHPTENKAVAAGDEGKVWLLNINDEGNFDVDLLGTHSSLVWVSHFFGEGKIVSTGHDACIKLWSIDSKQCIKEIPNVHKGGVWQIVRSDPSDPKIYTVGNDGKLKCTEFETGQEISSWKASTSFVWNLVPVWEKSLLITSSQDSVIHMWDCRAGTCQGRVKADEQLTILQHNPISWPDYLVGGDSQGQVNFWDFRKVPKSEDIVTSVSTLSTFASMSCHPNNIRDIVYDGTKIVVASKDNKSKIYDINAILNGKRDLLYEFTDSGAFSLDMTDTHLMIGTRDGVIFNYDFRQTVGFFNNIADDCVVM